MLLWLESKTLGMCHESKSMMNCWYLALPKPTHCCYSRFHVNNMRLVFIILVVMVLLFSMLNSVQGYL